MKYGAKVLEDLHRKVGEEGTGLRPKAGETGKGPGRAPRVASSLAPVLDFIARGCRASVKAVPSHLVHDLHWKRHTRTLKCLQGNMPASAKW